jgi:hypothetical protein
MTSRVRIAMLADPLRYPGAATYRRSPFRQQSDRLLHGYKLMFDQQIPIEPRCW